MQRNSLIELMDNRHARSAAGILNEDIQVVSFDIFDTLLYRDVFEPKDIFARVAADERVRAHPLSKRFQELRAKSERVLRLRLKAQGKQTDPTLAEIYREFSKLVDEQPSKLNLFRDVELQLELDAVAPRKPIKALYQYAISQGKTVVLCSDMYLPRATIEAMLEKCGYLGPHELFLSCDIGATKKHGTVFGQISSSLDVPASAIFHFGDNAVSDIKRAEEAGWKAMKTPSMQELFFAANDDLKGLFPVFRRPSDVKSNATRQNYSLVWSHLYEDQVEPTGAVDIVSKAHGFGYVALGPFLLSLSLWVLRNARQKQIDHVAFLARDGFLPIKAVTMLAEALGQRTEFSYLPISRRAIFPYFLHQPGGIDYILSIRFDPRQTIGLFLKERFGQVGLDLFLDAASENSSLSAEAFVKDHFDFVAELMKINITTLRTSTEQRYQSLVKEYKTALPAGKKHALFDVGRKGTFQSVLSGISGASLHGFYVVTDYAIQTNAPKRAYDSFLGMMDNRLNAKVPDTVLYEAFLSERGGSYTGFDENGKAIRDESSDGDEELQFFEALHGGAMEFVQDAVARYGADVDDLEQEGFYASYALENWTENPAVSDLLMDVRHEDSVSIPESKSLYEYFVKPRSIDANTLFPVRTNRKRIMIYAPAMTRIKGGAERIAARLANHMNDAGYEVLVFSSGNENDSIVPVYEIKPGVIIRNVDVKDVERLAILISAYKPDAGIVLASGPLVAKLGLAFLKNEVPFLLSERASPTHSMNTYWKGFSEEDYYAVYEAASMVAVQFDSFRDEFPVHMQNRVSVLSNPIVSVEKRKSKRNKTIVCAARIWFEQKRQDLLLRAFGKIADKYPDWSLEFYGASYEQDKNALVRLSSELEISKQVHISDPIDNISEKLENASIFVLPSAFEGFPNALAEALAVGAPSIGFAGCPGTNELIENGRNGLLVDDRDIVNLAGAGRAKAKINEKLVNQQLVDRLAAALEQLMSNDALRNKMSKAAFDSMKMYGAAEMNGAWQAKIENLLAEDGAAFKTQRADYLHKISSRLKGGASRRETAASQSPIDIDLEYRRDWDHLLSQVKSKRPPLIGYLKTALKTRTLPLSDEDLLQIAIAPNGKIYLEIPNSFDEFAYLEMYPDVGEAVRSRKIQSGFVHYMLAGHEEGRVRPVRK